MRYKSICVCVKPEAFEEHDSEFACVVCTVYISVYVYVCFS
jgi:hypothetical protein